MQTTAANTVPGASGRHGIFVKSLLCDKRSCEIREVLNVEPLVRIEKPQLSWFRHVSRVDCHRKYWRGKSCWLDARESGPEVDPGASIVTAFPTWLDPVSGAARTI